MQYLKCPDNQMDRTTRWKAKGHRFNFRWRHIFSFRIVRLLPVAHISAKSAQMSITFFYSDGWKKRDLILKIYRWFICRFCIWNFALCFISRSFHQDRESTFRNIFRSKSKKKRQKRTRVGVHNIFGTSMLRSNWNGFPDNILHQMACLIFSPHNKFDTLV